MKIKYRIFIVSFAIVILTVNFIGITLINNFFKTGINNEIERRIVDINSILNTTLLNFENISYTASNYYVNGVYTKVTSEEETVFTNIRNDVKEVEDILFRDLEDNYVNSFIKGNNLYLGIKKNNNQILITSSLESIYNSRDNMISYFTKLSIFISFLAAIILSIFTSLITRKIKKLSITALNIEKGNFDIEIPDLGHDEIGTFAKVFADMTKSIKKNIEEIETVSENRKLFIGNLTHEISTPLTSIVGYSSLIKNSKVKDIKTIKSYSEKIYEEGKYIESMRDKLLELMGLSKNDIPLEKINITNILKNYVKELQELYPDSYITLNSVSKIYKAVSQPLFKSLVFNLVKNSIKACSDKKPQIEILVDKDLLVIKDNGCGLKDSEIKKVLEPFYTGSKDRNRVSSSLGLGLPLAVRIAEYHHWQFQINSKENIGTTITINWSDNHE